ncbi:D-sedoheptulose 7-phosphate isomerase [Sanyastnella coralliicola]|uniref:D-sedoheptulose 7-phosphate isomerase n=1 Tax=Sanyastnella coralliicola TaxID=3069118 RepID=UPI0027BAD7BB|nr:D-sedoheptulose 7-phosphate isomerase [Longitalea sp. SCSIO 12813]
MSTEHIRQHFEDAARVLNDFFTNENNLMAIAEAGDAMVNALSFGNKILSCGNGGSMCDAMHFAEELSGRYRDDRPALAAISISDPSHMSCVGNDYGYEYVFSRYIEGLGREGDVLLAISTSGNSGNVLRAAEAARKLGITVVGLTGKDGGKLAPLCDVEIRAPWDGYADRIQEIHIKVIHSLIDHIERADS